MENCLLRKLIQSFVLQRAHEHYQTDCGCQKTHVQALKHNMRLKRQVKAYEVAAREDAECAQDPDDLNPGFNV